MSVDRTRPVPARWWPAAVLSRLRADARTVRARTTAAAVLVVGLALSGAAVALVLVLANTLTTQAETAARSRVVEVSAALSAGADPRNLTAVNDDERFLQLLDERGQVIAASRNLTGLGPVAAPQPGRVVRLRRPTGDGSDFVMASGAVGAPSGRITVLAASSLDDAADLARVAAGLLALGVPLLLVVVGGTTWFVVGRALAPVESLRAEVDQISSHELHRRVDAESRDNEITRLATTMNRMLERLQASQQRQHRFVSDASHELRSPVASIRQHAEVALAHPDRTTVPELARTVLAEDRRIQQLVEDLLLLARADEHDDRAIREPVDLDDLVLDHARRVRAAGLTAVDLSALSAGRVCGDQQLLSRLVGNLIENAARHARSRIALSLTQEPSPTHEPNPTQEPSLTQDETSHQVVLRVDDDGPGIPSADRERVFERFVRLDDARPRDTGGAGLGLAIVAEVVRAHGGGVEVGEAPLGGARFEVRLPALDD